MASLPSRVAATKIARVPFCRPVSSEIAMPARRSRRAARATVQPRAMVARLSVSTAAPTSPKLRRTRSHSAATAPATISTNSAVARARAGGSRRRAVAGAQRRSAMPISTGTVVMAKMPATVFASGRCTAS